MPASGTNVAVQVTCLAPYITFCQGVRSSSASQASTPGSISGETTKMASTTAPSSLVAGTRT